MEPRPIGELEPGERARVRGTVRRALSEPLRSPLGELPCVYWDVREGLDDAPRERDGQPFWIEDASGRALVRAGALDVEAKASRREAVIDAAEADYRDLSERLREIKERLRGIAGTEAADLTRERKRLAKLATLVCAIKAHARGKRHLGGSLAGQQRWIEQNAHLADGEKGVRAAALMVARWETVITDGQSLEVEAVFATEPMPAGIGAGGGYRDRPTCLVAGPLPEGAVRVIGVGASAPSTPTERRREQRDAERTGSAKRAPDDAKPKPDPGFERTVLGVVIAVAVSAALAWLMR